MIMTSEEAGTAILAWAKQAYRPISTEPQAFAVNVRVDLIGVIHQEANDTWEAVLSLAGGRFEIYVFFWFVEGTRLHVENVTEQDSPQEKEYQAGLAALDWQRLYDWTAAHDAGAILGESCTNSLDPLANYLHAQVGGIWSLGPSIKNGYGDRLRKSASVAA